MRLDFRTIGAGIGMNVYLLLTLLGFGHKHHLLSEKGAPTGNTFTVYRDVEYINRKDNGMSKNLYTFLQINPARGEVKRRVVVRSILRLLLGI